MLDYLVTFTPLEPFFFGNEKTFAGPFNKGKQQANNYYIRSEDLPAQTTILGALRYMAIPDKKINGKYTTPEKQFLASIIGSESFNLKNAESGIGNAFGKIRRISPLFIQHDKDQLVPTPMDCQSDYQNKSYVPFEYDSSVDTNRGPRTFPQKGQYNHKESPCDSFWSPCTSKIYKRDDIIRSVERIGGQAIKHGIRTEDEKGGLFRREFKSLKAGCSFAVYLETDLDFFNQTIFLGQCKSTFTVHFEQIGISARENLESAIREKLKRGIYYCWGDLYLNKTPQELYEKCLFANVAARDYRAYITEDFGAGVSKSNSLRHLIRSGSIFRSEIDISKYLENTYCGQIGYNILIGGESE